MKVIGLAGYSGAGKTTLLEQLIARLREGGERVSVVKHAHHRFDIDHPGKDSYRHRQAGAFEIVIASDRRLAKIREFEQDTEASAHDLIAELADCDWVFVEGFKHADLFKLEVWRAEVEAPVLYPHDPYVVAVATDQADRLPEPTGLPVLDLSDPAQVVDFLHRTASRYEYTRPDADRASARPAAADVLGGGPRPPARRGPAAADG